MTPSPSPVRPRRWVTFEESGTGESASLWENASLTSTEETSKGSELTEGDLGPQPSLDLDLEHFLGGHLAQQGQKEGEIPAKPMAQTSPRQPLWVDWVVGSMCGHTGLVEGITSHPWHRGPPGPHSKGKGLLWGTYGAELGLRREWLLCPTSPQVHWKGQVPATPRPLNGQPGLSPGATKEDLGLCQGTLVLGGEGKTADPWWAPPAGKKHTGVEVGHGATHDLPRLWGSLQWPHSIRSWSPPQPLILP